MWTKNQSSQVTETSVITHAWRTGSPHLSLSTSSISSIVHAQDSFVILPSSGTLPIVVAVHKDAETKNHGETVSFFRLRRRDVVCLARVPNLARFSLSNDRSVLSLLPAVFATAAFVLAWFGGIWCKFLSFTSLDDATGNGPPQPITLNFGIWYFQWYEVVDTAVQGTVILESCVAYPDSVAIDSKWKSARAFSTMALILGGVATFWSLLAGCLYPSKRTYRLGGMTYLLSCLFQGLSLLLLDSNACHDNDMLALLQQQMPEINLLFPSSCSMAQGAKCTIAATVFWFVAGLVAMKVDPPRRGPVTQETHDVTYTRTTNPEDGTTMVTETVVKGEPIVVG